MILSADWGKLPRKRAVYVGRPAPQRRIERHPPPAAGWSLDALVELARRLRDECEAPVLIGIDAVLGLPRSVTAALGAAGFAAGLRALERAGGLTAEAAVAADWKAERPFFRVPAGRGGLTRFYDAAGGRGAVLREIERRTGAKSVFVLSGIPGSVGSGSRALWLELLPILEERAGDLRLWPFDGVLAELTTAPNLVLAEVYPRAAYAAALAEDLPTRPRSVAKTRPPARPHPAGRRVAPVLGTGAVELPDRTPLGKPRAG